MKHYLLKKLLRLVLVLLGVSLVVFVLTEQIQGNPAEIVVSFSGEDLTQENVAAAAERLKLNDNILMRYLRWLGRAVQGDFGVSYITNTQVSAEILYRLPVSLKMTLLSFAAALLLAVPVGVFCAMRHDSPADHILQGTSFVLMGIPGFVLSLLAVYIISVRLKWLPMVGLSSWRHYILPVATLSIPMAARYARMLRANLLAVMDEEYVYLLRSRGFRERTILMFNALKNAFLPIISILGMGFGSLLGGSIVIESIFSLPGLGSYISQSINRRDYPVILAYVVMMAALFVLINLLVDLLSALLDPRIRLTGGDSHE